VVHAGLQRVESALLGWRHGRDSSTCFEGGWESWRPRAWWRCQWVGRGRTAPPVMQTGPSGSPYRGGASCSGAHPAGGRLATTVFGYEGLAPGPTMKMRQGRRVRLRVRGHPPLLYPSSATIHDVDPPARVGVAAAVRRLRQRRHSAGILQRLPIPERSARPDALVPRPRGTPHHGERLLRPGRAVPHPRPRRSAWG
jgi:hypothetical protein